ncbi:hypothetical protein ACQRXC_26490 (plasmid) [Niallia taxi]|uniref:hypothetical protein n=1 Tax=Niallia taxi TaxID=2499688 RepID=UPI0037CBD440
MDIDFFWIGAGLSVFGYFIGDGLKNFKNPKGSPLGHPTLILILLCREPAASKLAIYHPHYCYFYQYLIDESYFLRWYILHYNCISSVSKGIFLHLFWKGRMHLNDWVLV